MVIRLNRSIGLYLNKNIHIIEKCGLFHEMSIRSVLIKIDVGIKSMLGNTFQWFHQSADSIQAHGCLVNTDIKINTMSITTRRIFTPSNQMVAHDFFLGVPVFCWLLRDQL